MHYHSWYLTLPFFALLTLACTVNNNAPKVNSQTSPVARANSGPLSVGQSAKVGDVLVTYNSARIASSSTFTPKAGDQYVVADFTVMNTSDKPYTVSTLLSLSLFDKDKRKYGPTVGPDTNGKIEGTLAPHDTVRGEVVFEAPVDGAPYTVQYAQPIAGSSVTWLVMLPQ